MIQPLPVNTIQNRVQTIPVRNNQDLSNKNQPPRYEDLQQNAYFQMPTLPAPYDPNSHSFAQKY